MKPPKKTEVQQERLPTPIEGLIRQNLDKILSNEESAKRRRPRGEVIAENVTKFCGTMRFVFVHLGWFASWILLNLFLPQERRWDPSPFPFLTMLVALEAIFLVALILIAENHQAALAERREHLN